MPAKPPSPAPAPPSLSDASDTADVLNEGGLSTFAQPTGPVPTVAPQADINSADYQSSLQSTPDAVDLIDPRTGAPVPLPADKAEEAFRSGQLNVRDGATVHVRMPDGSVVAQDASKLGEALDAGAKLVSPLQARQSELEGRYGATAGTIAAGLAGVARTATFGASDWVAGQDKSSREVLAFLKSEHGIASGLGEAGGLLLTAGGAAAEEGVAGLLGKTVGGRLAGQAVRGLVEGAQLGHTEAVSEASLGDPKLTAEKYFASLGENALYGAGLGAVGGLIGEGASAAKSAMGEKIAKMLGRTPSAESVEKVAEKTFGYAPEGLGRLFTKMSSLASGESEESINEALAARHINIDAEKNGATRALTEHVNTLIKDAGDLQEEELKGAGKRAHLDESVNKLDKPQIALHSATTMADARKVVGGMLEDEERFGSGKLLKRMDAEFGRLQDKLLKAGESGDNAEQYALLDDTKRALGRWVRDVEGTTIRRSADPIDMRQARETSDTLQKLYDNMKTNLEDHEVWGKAGVDQRKLNAAWSEQIAAGRQFNARLATVTGEAPFGGRKILEADPAKIANYVHSLTNPNQDLVHRAISEYVEKTKALTSLVGDRYDLPAQQAAKVARATNAAEDFSATLKDVGPKLARANQLQAMIGREGSSGLGVAVLGHMIGGPVGGILAGAGTQLASPGKNIMRLAQLENLMGKFNGKIAGGVGKFFARGEEAAQAERAGIGTRVSRANRARKEAGEAQETTRTRFTTKAEQLRKLQADPSHLQASTQAHAAPLASSAPQTASMLGAIAAKAAGFLSAKMPTAPSDALTGKKGIPSEGEMGRYLRYSDTVEHPEHAVEDLAKGRLTVEQVDTLKAVYPKIYEELHAKVQAELVDHTTGGKAFTYQQRLQVGLLFDVDSDPSMAPPAINHAQATFSAPPAKPPGGNVSAGGAHSALATAIATPADAMSAGA